jgi:hypothetical protein
MSSVTQDDLERAIQARLREMPAAEWVREMIDHYRRTGSYRPKDLRRLLGDPNRGVDVGSNSSIASFYASHTGG